jgi:hypothetical protein
MAMAESKAFQAAQAKKARANAENLVRIREANAKVDELWTELVPMSDDLRRHRVTFEWGRHTNSEHTVGATFERLIVLRQHGRALDYANAIEYGADGFCAWGAFGTSLYDDNYKPHVEDLGRTPAEAALKIADGLVNRDRLPAAGELPSHAISDAAIAEEQRQENWELIQKILIGLVIAVGLVWLFS